MPGERDRRGRGAARGKAGRRLVGGGVLRRDPHDEVGSADQGHAGRRLLARLEGRRLADARPVHGGVQRGGDAQRALPHRSRLVLPREQQHGRDLGAHRRLPPSTSLGHRAREEARHPGALDEPLEREAGAVRRGLAPGLHDHRGERLRLRSQGRGEDHRHLRGARGHDEGRHAVEGHDVPVGGGGESGPANPHEVSGHPAGGLEGDDERHAAQVEGKGLRAALPHRRDDFVAAARDPLRPTASRSARHSPRRTPRGPRRRPP